MVEHVLLYLTVNPDNSVSVTADRAVITHVTSNYEHVMIGQSVDFY